MPICSSPWKYLVVRFDDCLPNKMPAFPQSMIDAHTNTPDIGIKVKPCYIQKLDKI